MPLSELLLRLFQESGQKVDAIAFKRLCLLGRPVAIIGQREHHLRRHERWGLSTSARRITRYWRYKNQQAAAAAQQKLA